MQKNILCNLFLIFFLQEMFNNILYKGENIMKKEKYALLHHVIQKKENNPCKMNSIVELDYS